MPAVTERQFQKKGKLFPRLTAEAGFGRGGAEGNPLRFGYLKENADSLKIGTKAACFS
jgi:hypothetical protein